MALARQLAAAAALAVLSLPALAAAQQAEPAPEAEPPAAPSAEPAEPIERPAPAPRPTSALVADLRSPTLGVRVEALRALADRGDPTTVGPIAALLRSDGEASVRGWAVRALAALGTAEANEALAAAAVADPDERVRSLARRLAGLDTPGPRVVRAEPAPGPEAPAALVAPRPPRPPGYSLRVAGWVMFAASYGIAFITGTALIPFGGDELDYGWKLMLPVVGPAVAATTAPIGPWSESRDAVSSVFLWIFTGVQATGVVLLSIGYAQDAAASRAAAGRGPIDDLDELASRRRRAPAFVLAPGGPGGPAGLSVLGSF